MSSSLILIVDDNFKNLQVLGSILKEAKFKAAIATSGFEALDFVNEKLPDLILLDIMMPEMDGIEVCKRLKSNEITKKIPIIFLTAKTDGSTIKEAFDAGAQDYIAKPFKSVELLSRVATHIEIKQNREALEQINATLEEKVQQRTLELTLANEKLNKIDKAKSDFLNLISHELRTPLNAIKGFSYILKDVVSDEKYSDFLDEINEAADKLVRISDISLLITSLQFENFKKRSVSTNLRHFIVSIADTYCNKFKWNREKLHLTLAIPESLVEIETTLISNALVMILDNAFKHSPSNEIILLDSKIENSQAVISITDYGKGFSTKALEKVFDFFTEKTLFSASGLGVGLATVKLIMNYIAGSVNAENVEGAGARVTISFPVNYTSSV